ncbi:hypothetical protein RCCS2_17786 [Roseobacter sp. CCS2]|nr:hypothetical protein RCCS2_17786 [Roseobacter sp. CCS2]
MCWVRLQRLRHFETSSDSEKFNKGSADGPTQTQYKKDYTMKKWERSFPAAQLTDHSWMIDVLEDLASYCAYNSLSVEELEMRKTLDRISSYQNDTISKNDQKTFV